MDRDVEVSEMRMTLGVEEDVVRFDVTVKRCGCQLLLDGDDTVIRQKKRTKHGLTDGREGFEMRLSVVSR